MTMPWRSVLLALCALAGTARSGDGPAPARQPWSTADVNAELMTTAVLREADALAHETAVIQAHVVADGPRLQRIRADETLLAGVRATLSGLSQQADQTVSTRLPLIDRYLYDFALERIEADFPSAPVRDWLAANAAFLRSGDLATRDAALRHRDAFVQAFAAQLPLRQLVAAVRSNGPLPAADRTTYLALLGGPRERTRAVHASPAGIDLQRLFGAGGLPAGLPGGGAGLLEALGAAGGGLRLDALGASTLFAAPEAAAARLLGSLPGLGGLIPGGMPQLPANPPAQGAVPPAQNPFAPRTSAPATLAQPAPTTPQPLVLTPAGNPALIPGLAAEMKGGPDPRATATPGVTAVPQPDTLPRLDGVETPVAPLDHLDKVIEALMARKAQGG